METISYMEEPNVNGRVISGTIQEYRINRPPRRRRRIRRFRSVGRI